MQNSTVPAAATGLPDHPSPEELKARKHFEQLYSNWLTARGDHADPAHEDEAARAYFSSRQPSRPTWFGKRSRRSNSIFAATANADGRFYQSSVFV